MTETTSESSSPPLAATEPNRAGDSSTSIAAGPINGKSAPSYSPVAWRLSRGSNPPPASPVRAASPASTAAGITTSAAPASTSLRNAASPSDAPSGSIRMSNGFSPRPRAATTPPLSVTTSTSSESRAVESESTATGSTRSSVKITALSQPGRSMAGRATGSTTSTRLVPKTVASPESVTRRVYAPAAPRTIAVASLMPEPRTTGSGSSMTAPPRAVSSRVRVPTPGPGRLKRPTTTSASPSPLSSTTGSL